MKTLLKFAAVLALALPAGAQDGITRQQADAILDELRQIRQLLEKQAKGDAPQEQTSRVKLNLEGYAMLGSKTAPLTVVEFTDYQCPFCQRFHVTTFADLKRVYIDTGKVRFYSKDLPLDMHANAMRAALAARCAGEQDGFWPLRNMMGANPDKLDLENILGFATQLKLDAGKLRACITSDKYKNAVQTDVLDAMRIGANGTPTFVVGRSTADGVDGELMVGALPFESFQAKLQALEAK
jgi:protein-disulfide isomerase